MKRFYKNAAVSEAGSGFEIRLDDRPVKTPARQPLVVPGARLADAIAAEWNAQGEKVDPRSMPFTGLSNAAIDRVGEDPAAFARSLALFGESDLLCYRADKPESLIERQAEQWDPLLVWARRRYDVELEVVSGVIHRPQPPGTVERLGRAVTARTPFQLAALAPLVTISGSLIIALALAEGAIDLDTAWSAASLDETWQLEQWGADAEAEAVLEARRQEFAAGYEFLQLL
ncbi:MAG TPA: ATP12 family protein [Allosphingosinicella sp.]|nr:ATP12 family protein [Allosphingosinicella sp.]